jgi:hypothetical protein
MVHLMARWIVDAFHRHFGSGLFIAFGEEYQALLENLTVGAIVWLICLWMYRRQIHIRL